MNEGLVEVRNLAGAGFCWVVPIYSDLAPGNEAFPFRGNEMNSIFTLW